MTADRTPETDRAAAVAAGFEAWAGGAPDGVWAAPGRVNLIGEHLDYNGGVVLPFAIDRCAWVAARRRNDGTVRCYSEQMGATCLVEASSLGAATGWPAYLAGTVWAMGQAGATGFDLYLDSDVPLGAGLSSSAAVECAVALAVSDLAGLVRDDAALAAAAHGAETEVVGAPVGIMDQTVSLLGRPGHLLRLDCRTGVGTLIPFDPGTEGLSLLVIDTGVAHELRDGAYGERRDACRAAAAALGVQHLALADPAEVATLAGVVGRRARHVVTEVARVRQAEEVLASGRLAALGPILTASHRSLRDDFEVSTPELDEVVEDALAAGALGARLTGGGFGGSAVVLAGPAAVAALRTRHPHAEAVRPGAGARRVPLSGSRR